MTKHTILTQVGLSAQQVKELLGEKGVPRTSKNEYTPKNNPPKIQVSIWEVIEEAMRKKPNILMTSTEVAELAKLSPKVTAGCLVSMHKAAMPIEKVVTKQSIMWAWKGGL